MGFSLVLWTISYRGLYADGSHFLLQIMATHGFHHVWQSRVTSTFLTQWPVVAAIRLGLRSIPALAALYTFSLGAIPAGCYIAAASVSRKDRVLIIATTIVVATCFYPLGFYIISEANVYLALFWLSFVLLLGNSPLSLCRALVLLATSAGALAAYETSTFFSALLGGLAIWRSSDAKDLATRSVLVVAASIFFCGSLIGLIGLLHPKSSQREQDFIDGLQTILQNRIYVLNVALALLGAASSLVPRLATRLVAQTILVVGVVLFVYSGLHSPTRIGLGYVIFQRAQIFVAAVLVVIGVLTIRFLVRSNAAFDKIHPLVLVLPLFAVVSIDTADTLGWSRYLVQECAELNADRNDPEFFREDASHKYGVGWTFPSVSVLLRGAASRSILTDPQFRGWQPFDPNGGVPNISEFKADGGLCRSITAA